MQDLKKLIEDAWEDRNLLNYNEYITLLKPLLNGWIKARSV
jgi:2,3,4,5-tetrahydropyridine-2-carboxylate N-succinyltransferase